MINHPFISLERITEHFEETMCSFLFYLPYLVREYEYISNKFKVNFTFSNIGSINTADNLSDF